MAATLAGVGAFLSKSEDMARRNVRSLFLAVLTSALFVGNVPGTVNGDRTPLVTATFQDEQLTDALREVARQLGMRIYIGPSLSGTANGEFVDERYNQVLNSLLQSTPHWTWFVSPGGTLVVSETDCCDIECGLINTEQILEQPELPPDAESIEIILVQADSARMLSFLRAQYPRVRFQPHLTQNGFTAKGSLRDLEAVKNETKSLDRLPPSAAPPIPRAFFLPHIEATEAKGILATLVPHATYDIDGEDILNCSGTPDNLLEVEEILKELDPDSTRIQSKTLPTSLTEGRYRPH